MRIAEQYLAQLNIEKRRWRRAAAILTVLSLMVAVSVAWNLRMTGITLVNDASCGYKEHQHSEECRIETLVCGYEVAEIVETAEAAEMAADGSADPLPEILTEDEPQHVHTDACYVWEDLCGMEEHLHRADCYSDPSADVETPLDWRAMFEDYPYTGDLRTDLVGVAGMQVGYTESERNFRAEDEVRYGYTRYGEWYGAPYNAWSAMFVSFCLEYAQADPDQYPHSSGANTMAGLWAKAGRYAEAGEYTPAAGDLVFFDNNTVGIVSEVQNTTIHVIGGDLEDAVRTIRLPMADGTIVGWGIADAAAEEEVFEEETFEEEVFEEPEEDRYFEEEVLSENEPVREAYTIGELSKEELYDTSHGPAVYLLVEDAAQTHRQEPQQIRFTLRSPRSVTDLTDYLNGNGGTYFYTLLDKDGNDVPMDGENHYIVQGDQEYKLYISFNSPNGYLQGTYQYQVPNGLMINGGSGAIELKNGVIVGTWEVTDTGLVTLIFNENTNSLTGTIISVTLGIHFVEQPDPLDFDGKIIVTVEKPPVQQNPTTVKKWGNAADPAKGQDSDKIYWTIEIAGNKDSQIPGNILSDRIYYGEYSEDHYYTESDIAGGLTIVAHDPLGAAAPCEWHQWWVSPDDPRLIWSETEWSYKIPQTATCLWCGEVELGNESWTYSVQYTSTPDRVSVDGSYGYENNAYIDGQNGYAWAQIQRGAQHGEIEKNGVFTSDGGEGSFVWEIRATIPAAQPCKRADYYWYIMDYMYLQDKDGIRVGETENHAHLSTVTAETGGATVHVPTLEAATDTDRFAWLNAWTAEENGIGYGKQIALFCRCNCTEETCMYWNEGTGCPRYWLDGAAQPTDFCHCWTAEEDVVFTFVYATEALPLVEEYGALEYRVQNFAELFYMPEGYNVKIVPVDNDTASVPIPSVFEKKLTQDFNGSTAHYRITVNEAKAVLTNGTPLNIRDEMTDTLAFISGSLVITAEDVNGNRNTLQQGKHYTVSYDGHGGQSDADGNPIHVLEIVILHPQPVMYILDYDTTLIMPEQITSAVKYSNSAKVTLWGQSISSDDIDKTHAWLNMSADSFSIDLLKLCALTRQPLEGAILSLYNEEGGQITSVTTGKNGSAHMKTDLANGIVLLEHQMYYVEETQAPAGYLLDSTRQWFVFCGKTADSCATCEAMLENTNGIRLSQSQSVPLEILNRPFMEELPATGGTGPVLYTVCGVPLIAAPMVYGLRLRHKNKRRFKHEAAHCSGRRSAYTPQK